MNLLRGIAAGPPSIRGVEQADQVVGRVVEVHARLVGEAFQAAPDRRCRVSSTGAASRPRRELDPYGGAARQVLADAQAASAGGEIDEGRRDAIPTATR